MRCPYLGTIDPVSSNSSHEEIMRANPQCRPYGSPQDLNKVLNDCLGSGYTRCYNYEVQSNK